MRNIDKVILNRMHFFRSEHGTLSYNHPMGLLGRQKTPSNIYLAHTEGTYLEDRRRYTIIESDKYRGNVSLLIDFLLEFGTVRTVSSVVFFVFYFITLNNLWSRPHVNLYNHVFKTANISALCPLMEMFDIRVYTAVNLVSLSSSKRLFTI